MSRMNTTEIAKAIRTDLKEMKGFKFSVRSEYFSGGSALSVDIMKSPLRMKRTMDEVPEQTNTQMYTREELTSLQNSKYHQLNQYQSKDAYNEESWNNGVFLTEAGHDTLKQVLGIIEKRTTESNCFIDVGLGRYDRDFIDGE